MDDREIYDALYAVLRDDARRIALGSSSVSPTSLVHEAWLKMRGSEQSDAVHFRALAAMAMRQVLIDRVRRAQAIKRGGPDARQVTLTGLGRAGGAVDLAAVNEALEGLERRSPRQARIAVLRVFGGLSEEECAQECEVSLRTVRRDWRAARAWLSLQLQG